MDKIEKIKEWVKKQKKEELARNSIGVITGKALYVDTNELLSFLDTLSEEPDKSLEEAAKDAVCMAFGGDPAYYGNKAEFSVTELERLFIAGWKCRNAQILKDAVEGYVNYYEDSGGILMAEAQVGCPYHNGDKVRIVVLKEEEE